jgi:hypothetical protein
MKALANNKLAIFQANWKQFPSSEITLLTIMREIIAAELVSFNDGLADLIQRVNKPSGTRLTAKEVSQLVFDLDDLTITDGGFEEMGWKTVAQRFAELKFIVNERQIVMKVGLKTHRKALPTVDRVYHAIFELRAAFYDALDATKFAMLENNKSHLLQQAELFGSKVWKAFPSARPEIRQAGNCLAADLNTAAVFHLMRTAEFGMRALSLHLKIRLKGKPVEHAGWNELIEQIEKKIRLRRDRYDKSRRKNKAELEFLKFCRMMADELYKYKEIWRNNTMHSISSYNEAEARGVFDRVKDFMQNLSTRVSENS